MKEMKLELVTRKFKGKVRRDFFGIGPGSEDI